MINCVENRRKRMDWLDNLNTYSITTNDGTGHGDTINHFQVMAASPAAAFVYATKVLNDMNEFDTDVISADLVKE